MKKNFWKKRKSKREQALESSVCFFRITFFYGVTLLLTLGMMFLIFHFSGENATLSSDLSGGICERIIHFINQRFQLGWNPIQMEQWAELIETPVRKCAHFTEYTVLSVCANLHGFSLLLLNKGEKYSGQSRRVKLSMVRPRLAYSSLFCVLYAISDEIHQYFVPGRACRFFDVCVDSGGILAGALLVWLILRIGIRRKKEESRNRFVY